ncbi:MAG TPA: hypothetical protein VFA18_18165 [Gemmataceae bacterium]|nr:hypothetical protein [Gemmataceae bacterium]
MWIRHETKRLALLIALFIYAFVWVPRLSRAGLFPVEMSLWDFAFLAGVAALVVWLITSDLAKIEGSEEEHTPAEHHPHMHHHQHTHHPHAHTRHHHHDHQPPAHGPEHKPATHTPDQKPSPS